MHLFYQSLGVRVILLITAVTVTVFSGLFLANSFWQNRSTHQLVSASSNRTADLILMAVEEPMRLGKNTETAHVFEKVAKRDPSSRIYLTDYKGNVTYSTEPKALRQDLAPFINNESVKGLLSQSLAGQEGAGRVSRDGGEFLAMSKPIKNEEECHHCHGKSKAILGAVLVLQDITPTLAQTGRDQMLSGGISLAGLVLLLALVTWFMKRAVLSRIKTIASNASLVRQGRHDVDFAMAGQDELSGLSRDLAGMVRTIQDQLEYNRSVLAGMSIPIYISDEKGEFCYLNDHLSAILGKPKNDLACSSVDIILSAGGAPVTITQDVLRDGINLSGKLHYERDDGVIFPLHFQVSPLRGLGGKITGVIGVLMDLTEEEEAKLAIEEQRASLMEVAHEVMQVSDKLSVAAQALSGQMGALTSSVEQTAAETSKLTMAMDQMNDAVGDVAKNASETAKASDKANAVAKSGGQEIGNTAQETKQVAHRAEELAGSLGDLKEKALNIGKVMDVVGDIADQTNLLALNAAIEAARAGDAGRGFAVVADEVRKLAEKTMHATSEVAQAVKEIQDGTTHAASGMAGTKQAVEKAASMAERSGTVFADIVTHSDSIADMIRAIASAVEQQSSTSETINVNVSHINVLSQDIFSRIREAHQSIDDVRTLSGHLSGLAARFSHNGNGSSARSIQDSVALTA